MKTKNLMIGNIARIEYKETSLEDYWPSAFYESWYGAETIDTSVFYVTKKYACDLRNLRIYKIAKSTDLFTESMEGEKVVLIKGALSDVTIEQKTTRREAIKIYTKMRNN